MQQLLQNEKMHEKGNRRSGPRGSEWTDKATYARQNTIWSVFSVRSLIDFHTSCTRAHVYVKSPNRHTETAIQRTLRISGRSRNPATPLVARAKK
jgi:hypothetical protein